MPPPLETARGPRIEPRPLLANGWQATGITSTTAFGPAKAIATFAPTLSGGRLPRGWMRFGFLLFTLAQRWLPAFLEPAKTTNPRVRPGLFTNRKAA